MQKPLNCVPHQIAIGCRMARLARMVLPGIPHHITQRGNRRERTFFEDDYVLYLDLLADGAERADVEI